MLILKLLSSVYSSIGTIFNSVYHWIIGDIENNPDVGDVNLFNDTNPAVLQPELPPNPPPLAGLQLFAAMQFPFLQHNRGSLRDLLQPLAEALVEHPTGAPLPLPRLGKRWRRETQPENVQAIEKALEQFEMEETLEKQDSHDSIIKADLKESSDEIYNQMDGN